MRLGGFVNNFQVDTGVQQRLGNDEELIRQLAQQIIQRRQFQQQAGPPQQTALGGPAGNPLAPQRSYYRDDGGRFDPQQDRGGLFGTGIGGPNRLSDGATFDQNGNVPQSGFDRIAGGLAGFFSDNFGRNEAPTAPPGVTITPSERPGFDLGTSDLGSAAGAAAGLFPPDPFAAEDARLLEEFERGLESTPQSADNSSNFRELAELLTRRQGRYDAVYQQRTEEILSSLGGSGVAPTAPRARREAEAFGRPTTGGADVATAEGRAERDRQSNNNLLDRLEDINANFYREQASQGALLEEAFERVGNQADLERLQAENEANEDRARQLEDLQAFGFTPQEHTTEAYSRFIDLTQTNGVEAAAIADGISAVFAGRTDYDNIEARLKSLEYRQIPQLNGDPLDKVFTSADVDRIVDQIRKFLGVDRLGRSRGFFDPASLSPQELELLGSYSSTYFAEEAPDS